VILPH